MLFRFLLASGLLLSMAMGPIDLPEDTSLERPVLLEKIEREGECLIFHSPQYKNTNGDDAFPDRVFGYVVEFSKLVFGSDSQSGFSKTGTKSVRSNKPSAQLQLLAPNTVFIGRILFIATSRSDPTKLVARRSRPFLFRSNSRDINTIRRKTRQGFLDDFNSKAGPADASERNWNFAISRCADPLATHMNHNKQDHGHLVSGRNTNCWLPATASGRARQTFDFSGTEGGTAFFDIDSGDLQSSESDRGEVSFGDHIFGFSVSKAPKDVIVAVANERSPNKQTQERLHREQDAESIRVEVATHKVRVVQVSSAGEVIIVETVDQLKAFPDKNLYTVPNIRTPYEFDLTTTKITVRHRGVTVIETELPKELTFSEGHVNVYLTSLGERVTGHPALTFHMDNIGFTSNKQIQVQTLNYKNVQQKGYRRISARDCVTLYADSPFTGATATMGDGFFNHRDIEALGLGNDQMSSLKIGEGCEATLSQNTDESGWQITLTAGEYDVNRLRAAGGFNDDLSAIRVSGGSQALPFTCTTGQGSFKGFSSELNLNSAEACSKECLEDPKCVSFDFTRTSKDDSCRLFEPTVRRFDGGSDNRQFCVVQRGGGREGASFDINVPDNFDGATEARVMYTIQADGGNDEITLRLNNKEVDKFRAPETDGTSLFETQKITVVRLADLKLGFNRIDFASSDSQRLIGNVHIEFDFACSNKPAREYTPPNSQRIFANGMPVPFSTPGERLARPSIRVSPRRSEIRNGRRLLTFDLEANTRDTIRFSAASKGIAKFQALINCEVVKEVVLNSNLAFQMSTTMTIDTAIGRRNRGKELYFRAIDGEGRASTIVTGQDLRNLAKQNSDTNILLRVDDLIVTYDIEDGSTSSTNILNRFRYPNREDRVGSILESRCRKEQLFPAVNRPDPGQVSRGLSRGNICQRGERLGQAKGSRLPIDFGVKGTELNLPVTARFVGKASGLVAVDCNITNQAVSRKAQVNGAGNAQTEGYSGDWSEDPTTEKDGGEVRIDWSLTEMLEKWDVEYNASDYEDDIDVSNSYQCVDPETFMPIWLGRDVVNQTKEEDLVDYKRTDSKSETDSSAFLDDASNFDQNLDGKYGVVCEYIDGVPGANCTDMDGVKGIDNAGAHLAPFWHVLIVMVAGAAYLIGKSS